MFLGVTLLSIIVIIAIFGTVASMSHVPAHFLTAMVIAACAAAFGIVALLIRFMLRLTGIDRPDVARDQQGFKKHELPPQYAPHQITGPPQSIGSVTENTTRNFGARDAAQNRND
ncbi:MAG TPA: hypothetical protein VFV34_23590 [Blastocatellia bacterium]|nr:hypothetical protein [Blastocatellia bacterium]